MTSYYISNGIIKPLVILFKNNIYCISNDQRKGSQTKYSNIHDSNDSIIPIDFIDDKYEWIMHDDKRFHKAYPHFSKNAQRLCKDSPLNNITEILVLNGMRFYNSPIILTTEIVESIRDSWNCNWDNNEGSINIVLSFDKYYYVYSLEYITSIDNYTHKYKFIYNRYNKQLFNEATQFFTK